MTGEAAERRPSPLSGEEIAWLRDLADELPDFIGDSVPLERSQALLDRLLDEYEELMQTRSG